MRPCVYDHTGYTFGSSFKSIHRAFLAALQGIVSTRGLPTKIISDNATNFVGANNEPAKSYQTYSKKVFICYCN